MQNTQIKQYAVNHYSPDEDKVSVLFTKISGQIHKLSVAIKFPLLTICCGEDMNHFFYIQCCYKTGIQQLQPQVYVVR